MSSDELLAQDGVSVSKGACTGLVESLSWIRCCSALYGTALVRVVCTWKVRTVGVLAHLELQMCLGNCSSSEDLVCKLSGQPIDLQTEQHSIACAATHGKQIVKLGSRCSSTRLNLEQCR